ncbi:SpoIIE family protein phosphatase [Anaerosinus gibii]|uniref:SpoIIE family protein phosphatase n=1 Tax=Selenobaculum gibii TaxID=3054208 RepID=A0A9Y2AIA4_9FIRM|nr:SpoIIE family protein phosphatase [Selenobaculum gbiensis]WIW71349.1 SpoIIE family protein phosphatase [Selenobaculum gbiensis]
MQKTPVMTFPKEFIAFMTETKRETRNISKNIFSLESLKGQAVHLLSYRDHILLNLLAVLLGRLTILGDLSPFGLAFFAAVLQVEKNKAITVGFWSLMGVLSAGRYQEAIMYLIVIVGVLKCRMQLNRLQRKVVALPLMVFSFIFISGIIVNFCLDAALYDNLVVLFNAFLCVIAIYLFKYGLPLILNRSLVVEAYHKAANEAMIGFVFILALGVAGIGDIRIADYQMQVIVGNMMIIALALAGGAGLGASVGVVLGIVIGLSSGGNAMATVALYAVSGTVAGLFRGLGKYAVILGFILGNLFMQLGFTQLPLLLKSLTEALIAIVILFFLPLGKIMSLQDNLNVSVEGVSVKSKILDENNEKLNRISTMFYELGSIFSLSHEQEKESIEEIDIEVLLSSVSRYVCESCPCRQECWDDNYYKTYQSFMDLFRLNNAKKKTLQYLPDLFENTCVNTKEILRIIEQTVSKNQMSRYWQYQFLQQKEMVSEQMKATGNILSNLAEELRRLPHDRGNRKQRIATQYKVKPAIASIAKENQIICGDNTSITKLNHNRVGILISDGMGSGDGAARESKMTVDCLGKLLQAGFSIDVSVKTVNSLLALRSAGENFATVDMAIIDQYNGEVEFLKISAAVSYIKRVREIIPIRAAALPIGILNHIEIVPTQARMVANDFLIMLSDGIDDIKELKQRYDDKDGWLINFLRRADYDDPQDFANGILNEAMRLSDGKAKDDMTVIVVKLIER